MNLKTWAPVAIAVVLGGIAAKIAHDAMTRGHAPAPVSKAIQVVVAKSLVQPGQPITADQIALSPVAGAAAPANTFADLSAVAGRIATAPLFPGQPVFEGSLAPRGSEAGLAAMVPPGMRAITIDVNETSSLAGMLTPGSHVDVLAVITEADAASSSARTVVQNVLVQAVGQRLSNVRPAPEKGQPAPTNDVFRSVTLIVTPHDAEALQLVSASTRMTLLLRGPGDDLPNVEKPVSIGDLLGKAAPAPVVQSVAATQPVQPIRPEPQVVMVPVDPPPPLKRTVELIRAGGSMKIEFDLPRTSDADSTDLLKPAVPDQEPEE